MKAPEPTDQELEIEKLTGLSVNSQRAYQFEQGIGFLEWKYHGLTETLQALKQSPEFWKWWRMMWVRDEQVFLHSASLRPDRETDLVLLQWQEFHKGPGYPYYPTNQIIKRAKRCLAQNKHS